MTDYRDKFLSEFSRIADCLESYKGDIIDCLRTIETQKTAITEFEKTVSFRTYRIELQYLINRRPMGKVAVMLPFNNPLYSLVLYAFGPILSGNIVCVRPSSLTASALLNIWRIILPITQDLPISICQDSGKEFIRNVLCETPVNVFIFTGTWSNVTRLLNEINPEIKFIYSGSGINPFVILNDADVDKAIPSAIYSRIYNSGQDCLDAERYYISHQIYDEFRDKLILGLEKLKIGPLTDPETDIGPVTTMDIIKNVNYLRELSKGYGDVVYGGDVIGQLVFPTVIETVNMDPIVNSEKYSVIIPLVKFYSEDELLFNVNASDYQLGVTVYGNKKPNLNFKAPHVVYNSCLLLIEDADAHVPFGGHNKSGFTLHQGIQQSGPVLFSVETSLPYE